MMLYGRIWIVTIIISLSIWALANFPTFISPNFLQFLLRFLWLRTFCQLLIWYVFRLTNKEGFVFYHHFGYSERRLAVLLYLMDLSIFLLTIASYTLLSALWC